VYRLFMYIIYLFKLFHNDTQYILCCVVKRAGMGNLDRKNEITTFPHVYIVPCSLLDPTLYCKHFSTPRTLGYAFIKYDLKIWLDLCSYFYYLDLA